MTEPAIIILEVVIGVLILATLILNRRVSVKVGAMSAEFTPNGGSSMRDAIDRMEARQAEHDEAIQVVTERVASLEGVAKRVVERLGEGE